MEPRILKRSDKVRNYFPKYGIENFLITKSEDVSYLTGLSGDDCAVLITADKKYILTDARYETAMSVLKPEFELVVIFDYIDHIKAIKPKKMGIQDTSMTLSVYSELASAIPEKDLISATGIMEDLRLTKEIEELEIINDYIGKIEELEKLPNLRKLKISSVNMRTMRKDKMMILDNRRYDYESKKSGIKDFSVIERLEKLEFLQIDNEENLRKINTENLKNLVSLKLRDNPNLKEVRGLDFNEKLSELNLEHNRRR